MSVFRTPGSRFYRYNFTLFDPRIGKRKRFSESTRTEDEAEARRREAEIKAQAQTEIDEWVARHEATEKARAALDHANALVSQATGASYEFAALTGAPAPRKRKPPMTIRQAVDRYFEEKVDGKKSAPETAAVLDRLATFFGDDTLLPDLTSDEIAAYVSWRKVQTAKAGRNKGKAPVAPASVNREVELLRRVLYRARKTWKRQIDDEIDWTELRLAEPEERVRYLTAAEEARLVPVMLRQRMEVLAPFAFAINTGARQSAVLKLKWADIDFEQRLFSIKLKSNKPGGETHYIDLDDTSLGILGSQTDENGEPLHPEFVFTYECRHPRGARKKGQRHPWTPTGLTKIWKGILREARIEDFRWHDLRHTAATRMLQEKGDLAKVKKMLGHKSITSTARYAHVDRRDQREAMVAVGRRNAGLLHQLHTSQGLHQPIPLIDLDKSA